VTQKYSEHVHPAFIRGKTREGHTMGQRRESLERELQRGEVGFAKSSPLTERGQKERKSQTLKQPYKLRSEKGLESGIEPTGCATFKQEDRPVSKKDIYLLITKMPPRRRGNRM